MRSVKRKTIADYCDEGHSRPTAAFLTWFNNNLRQITNVVRKENAIDMIEKRIVQAENVQDRTVLNNLLDRLDEFYPSK